MGFDGSWGIVLNCCGIVVGPALLEHAEADLEDAGAWRTDVERELKGMLGRWLDADDA